MSPAPAASPDAGTCSCCCHRAVRDADQWRQMSRADRRMNMCLGSQACDDGGEHNWIPVSFRFETQLLDGYGRVSIRQPDLKQGRVYVVCMACRTHTYVDTEWAGYYLGGPDYGVLEPADPDEDDPS
jgi:NMD protein affecting ribosome stability and mRNA decay